MQARAAGCAWCDLEVETLRELPGKSVDGYAVPGKILLSMHDFRKTPEFPKKLTVPAMGGATAIKVATMARSLSDSARVLRLAHNSHDVVATLIAVAPPMAGTVSFLGNSGVFRRSCIESRIFPG